MLLYISILGIFLSVVLIYFNARRYTSSIYLAFFSLFISLYALNQYVILYSGSEFWISILFTNITFLSYLIGPMCYMYTRSVLTDDTRFKKVDLLHFLPMLIHLSASIPYMLTPYSYKVKIANAIRSDSGFISSFHATPLTDLFSNKTVYLSRPVLALIYLFWSIILFITYKSKREKISGFSRQHFMNKWLIFFLGFQFLLLGSHLCTIFSAFHFPDSDLLYTTNFLMDVSFVGLIGLLITPFFFPQILYGLPTFTHTNTPMKDEIEELSVSVSGIKKTPPNFELDYMLTIVQRMTTCMQEQKPYLQPDFNLSQFAVSIDIPSHHLSYFFREIKKQSFNDYRNECRIDYSKKLIMEGKAEELTLEAIGIQSGFTNRNTFFTAFKKVEGISPSAFLSRSLGHF